MKKVLNADVTNVVEESLTGYLLAYKNTTKNCLSYMFFYFQFCWSYI